MKHIAFCLVLLGLCAAARADEFDSDGVKIHYIDEGKGDPVVLVHGFASSIKLNWELPGVVGLLSKSYRVIALDCRGFGQSDKPEGEENYGVKMVDDVIRLMDHLEVKKAHIVGYSMGGIIAMKFVAAHADRVTSVVLGGMGWLKAGGVLGKAFELMPGRGGGAMPEGCFQSLGALGLTEEEVKGIKVPVSMIVGDRDPCRLLYVHPLAEARPDFPVLEVPDAGHLDCIMKQEFKDGLKADLDKHAGK